MTDQASNDEMIRGATMDIVGLLRADRPFSRAWRLEAADEIERLRAKNRELASTLAKRLLAPKTSQT